MAHAPPVPPDQQSHKGAGEADGPDIASDAGAGAAVDPNQKTQGEAGNRNQNFTPHLRTQDR